MEKQFLGEVLSKNNVIIAATILAVAILMIGVANAQARFCAPANSPLGQVTDKLLKLGKMQILLQPNNQTIKQTVANLTNIICKPGENSTLFQTKTNQTNGVRTTPMTQPQQLANRVNIYINTTNLLPESTQVSSAFMYLNTTDGHYHVSGIVKNIIHETVDTPFVSGTFFDTATNSTLRSIGPAQIKELEPGVNYI